MVDHNTNNVMPLIKINGYDFTDNLTTFHFNVYDLQDADSGDDQAGLTHYNLVRADKMQVECGWEMVDDNFKNDLLAAIASAKNIPVIVSYAGTLDKSINCYRGDRSIEMISFKNATVNNVGRYWNVSFNLIEM